MLPHEPDAGLHSGNLPRQHSMRVQEQVPSGMMSRAQGHQKGLFLERGAKMPKQKLADPLLPIGTEGGAAKESQQ